MSPATTLIVVGAIVATAVFAAGFMRGIRQALSEYGQAREIGEEEDLASWAGIGTIFAFIASIVVITLYGVGPAWIYLGPTLALISALGVGICFFTE